MIGSSVKPSVVYLCAEPVDFRKGMGSLAVMIESQMHLNPFDQTLYVFANRQYRAIKILYWDRNGFCLWHKRLEKEHYHWIRRGMQGVVSISYEQLEWLLRGYDISLMTPHKTLKYQSVT